MFLVALLVSFSISAKADITLQEPGDWLSIGGVTPVADGQTMYYLKNVGTGLMLSHGAEWGTAAAESQSAHPIIIESNGDGTYALGSLGGYLGTNMFMDRPKSESQWVLQPVAEYPGQYHIQLGTGEDAALLSSVGNRMGKLTAKVNEGKALQRWIFVDGNYMRNEIMPAVSEEMPIDVSWAIRAGSFDKVGTWYPKVENGVPFTSEVFYSMMGDDLETDANGNPVYHGYQAEYWDGLWGANRKYGAHCGNEGGWDDAAKNYNFCAIINKNNRDAASTLVTYKMTLPAGVYRLQYDAFYRFIETKVVQPQNRSRKNTLNNWPDWQNNGSETTTISDKEMSLMVLVSGNGLTTKTGTVPQNKSVVFDDGISAANEFRNAKNLASGDAGYESRYATFENNFTFRVNTQSEVTISVAKGATTESVWDKVENEKGNYFTDKSQTRDLVDYLYDYQVYLDNFCLYYSGVPSDAPEEVTSPYDAEAEGNETIIKTMFWYEYPSVSWSSLRDLNRWLQNPNNKAIYDAWVAEHDYYFSEVPQPNRYGSYDYSDLEDLQITKAEYDTAKDAYDDYKELSDAYDAEMQSRYESADKNMIFKNYLEANFEHYLDLLGAAGDEVLIDLMSDWLKTENGVLVVDKNKITSRVKYYDALEQLEAAFLQAKIADLKSDISADGNDFTGLIVNPSFEEGLVAGQGSTLGWTVGNTTSTDMRVASRTFNVGSYIAQGMHGNHLFNIWSHGAPITQKVSMPNNSNGSPQNLRNGTYLLSALITSDPGAPIWFTAKPNNADMIKRCVSTLGANVFEDYGMKVELNNAKDLTIGVVGGLNDADGSYVPEGHWWYKCDNFRLEYLPNGILPLKDEDVKIKNLIDPFDGVNVTRSISFGNWSTLVLPFDMPKPSDWEIETLTEVSQYNGDIKLVFGTPTEAEGGGSVLKAGVPYIVRVKSQVTAIEAENVDVNTTLKLPGLKESGEYTVEFVPVYVQGYVPASAIEKDADGNPVLGEDGNAIAAVGPQYYFLSGGKLKRCIYENSNKIKGFRGYFKVTPATQAAARKLRTIGMQTSEETDIENVATEEVTVVGIYDVNGIRLSEMKPGINILRMNNGTTKKVMVK